MHSARWLYAWTGDHDGALWNCVSVSERVEAKIQLHTGPGLPDEGKAIMTQAVEEFATNMQATPGTEFDGVLTWGLETLRNGLRENTTTPP